MTQRRDETLKGQEEAVSREGAKGTKYDPSIKILCISLRLRGFA
jgi:hypothetical protein